MGTERRSDTDDETGRESTPAQCRRAALVVAGYARDANDLATLLSMLGLDARPPSGPAAGPPTAVAAPALPPKYLAELAGLATRSHAGRAGGRGRARRTKPGGLDGGADGRRPTASDR